MRNSTLAFDPGGDTPIVRRARTGNTSSIVQDAAPSRYQILLEGHDEPLICSLILTCVRDVELWLDRTTTAETLLPLENSVSAAILNAVEEVMRDWEIQAPLVFAVYGGSTAERGQTRTRRWNTRPKGRFKDTTAHSSEKPLTTILPPRIDQIQMADNASTLAEGLQTANSSSGRITCVYIDPVTGARCNDASSRPYDVARHLRVHVRREDSYDASNIYFSPRLRDSDPQRLMDLGVPRKSAFSGSAASAMLGDNKAARNQRRRTGERAALPRRKRRGAHAVADAPAVPGQAGPSTGSFAATRNASLEAHTSPTEPVLAFPEVRFDATATEASFLIPPDIHLTWTDLLFGEGMPATTVSSRYSPLQFPSSDPMYAPDHPMMCACPRTGSPHLSLIMNEVGDHEPLRCALDDMSAPFPFDELGMLPPPLPLGELAQPDAGGVGAVDAGGTGAEGAEGVLRSLTFT